MNWVGSVFPCITSVHSLRRIVVAIGNKFVVFQGELKTKVNIGDGDKGEDKEEKEEGMSTH